MIRRLAGLVLVVCALLALLAEAALGEAPAGPRLAFLSSPVSRSEVLSVDPSGGESLTIAGGSEAVRPLPLPFSAIGWSPDGSLLAFSGLSGSQKEPRFDLYVVGADGSGVRRIPGTRNALYPLFSPDGHNVAFTRIARTHRSDRDKARRPRVRFSSWLANLDTGAVTRLPAKASDVASSFSPDGSTLAVSRAGKGPVADAVAIDLTTGRSSVLARNAAGPVYSPDGSRIAFLRGPERTFHDRHGSTAEVLTDGDQLRRILDPKTILLSPIWQPGPGREAGPISC